METKGICLYKQEINIEDFSKTIIKMLMARDELIY